MNKFLKVFPEGRGATTRLVLSGSKEMAAMSEEKQDLAWTPPEKIETLFGTAEGNQWASINAPTAGARKEVDLPCGSAAIQLYSLGTPNGKKVSILLEELSDLGLLEVRHCHI